MSMQHESPFRIPNSETIFQYNESIKKNKDESRLKTTNQKIYDKKTASTRSEFKHYKKFEGSNQQKESLDNQQKRGVFQKKDKVFINMALEIVQERQKKNSRMKNEEKSKGSVARKENNIEMVDQIKEMFLVTMSHGIIENEIKEIKTLQQKKQGALEQCIRLIQDDQKYYEEYDNDKKKEVDHQLVLAEEEIKMKKSFENEYKLKFNQLNSLKHDIQRNEELVNIYNEHRQFLEKLTSKEWLEAREKEKSIKLETVRSDCVEEYRIEGLSKKQAEEKFLRLLNADKLPECQMLEFEDNMYFTHPQQLENNFVKLEERSLFLIDKTQNLNLKYEDYESNYKKKKKKYEEQIKNLESQKKNLKNNLDGINSKIKGQRIFDQSKQKESFDMILNPITRNLTEIYIAFREEIGNLGELQQKEPLKLLERIENHLNKQIKNINQYSHIDDKMVREFKEKYEKQRIFKAKEDKEKDKQRLIDEKNQKNILKTMQPIKKREGRSDMRRSSPQQKEAKKVEKLIDQDELDDLKYFQESD